MCVVVQIAFGPISVWLVSRASWKEVDGCTPRWLGTILGKLQIAMRKNGCLGDVLGQDH